MKFEEMINNIILGDCYEIIKSIPDKSIDCIYVDVPYLYKSGGVGTSEIAKRATKNKIELMGAIDDYNPKLSNKENLKIAKNKKNSVKEYVDISNGFDYKLFIKEAFRIMKKPNIFIWCSQMQLLDIMNELKKI